MTLQERMEFCTICENRKTNINIGLTCGLTDEKPKFEKKCESFKKDIIEAERKFKQRLDAAGNSRSQDGSLKPKRNFIYGTVLTIIGLFIFLLSMIIGGLIIASGVSFIIRGIQQKKIIKENNLLNEKISS